MGINVIEEKQPLTNSLLIGVIVISIWIVSGLLGFFFFGNPITGIGIGMISLIGIVLLYKYLTNELHLK